MKNFKKLREEALRQQQRHEHVLNEGDLVMSSRTGVKGNIHRIGGCLLYTSPSPRDGTSSRMPSSA